MAYGLLNSIAKDLDCMLNDLCQTLPESSSRHEPTRSLPNITNVHPLHTSNHNHRWSTTIPRRSSVPQHTISRLENKSEQSKENSPSLVSHTDGRTNLNEGFLPPSALKLSGLADKGGGQEQDKLPGLDGYQNNVPVNSQSRSPDEASWGSLSESDVGSATQPCHISLLERLILTHPIWFLRGIYRTGAIHLLQGKEVGNFIIRQSSQPNTMAITVRLPPDKGPYTEHYLIEAVDGKLRLEGSDNHFPAIPMLVAHYSQCCDELPVQLTLPSAIRDTNSKQQLSSIAHLGQEFWISPLLYPSTSSPGKQPAKPVMPLPSTIPRAHMSTFGSPTSPTTKDFGAPLSPSPTSPLSVSSSTSSLTTAVAKQPSSPVSKEMSPFRRSLQRPTPPPRWFVPTTQTKNGSTIVAVNAVTTTESPSTNSIVASSSMANFTVTTTVTFHVNQCTAALPISVETPTDDSTNGHGLLNGIPPQPTITTTTTASLTRRAHMLTPKPTSPSAPLVESPPGYHCSSLADKISDYEDIWPCTPSPVSNPESVLPTGPSAEASQPSTANHKPSTVGHQQQPQDGATKNGGDELHIVKALKSLGLSSTSHNWEYSVTNQTDQEKVYARDSQRNSEQDYDGHLAVQSDEDQNRKSKSQPGLVAVLGPKIPLVNLPLIPSTECDAHRANPSPFYSEPVDSLFKDGERKRISARCVEKVGGATRMVSHRHSDPNIRWPQNGATENERTCSKIGVATSEPRLGAGCKSDVARLNGLKMSGSQHLSSSLTDLRTHSNSRAVPLRGGGGGFINDGFRSSSSQLLASKELAKDLTRQPPKEVGSQEQGWTTLPRVQAKNNTLQRTPIPQDLLRELLATNASPTPVATLTKDGGKSFNESSWRVDSSWAWYTRHCGSLPSDTDSSSEDDLMDQQTEDEELSLVQLRQRGCRFPVLRPSGCYISSSFLNSSESSNAAAAVTVEQLLTQKSPQLRVPEIKPLTASNLLRVSEYDNLDSDDDEDGNGGKEGVGGGGVGLQPTKAVRPSIAIRKYRQHAVNGVDVPSRPPWAGVGDAQKTRLSRPSGTMQRQRHVPSETGSSATEFSEPWDSSHWEKFLIEASIEGKLQPVVAELKTRQRIPDVAANNHLLRSATQESADYNRNELDIGGGFGPVEKTQGRLPNGLQNVSLIVNGRRPSVEESQSTSTTTNDNEDLYANFASSQEKFQKIPALPCLLSLRRKDRHLGKPIRDYVFKMAQDKSLIFGRHIENFIQCTLESHERNPHVMMRNIRQFMSGMANFLVNSGEGKFSNLVQEERAKLKPNEFLNLDTILEGVMHKIVVRPLRQHICNLFVKEYTSNGAVTMLSDSIKFARTRTPEQLGIKSDLTPPQGRTMEMIKHYMAKLQKAYSPLKKLENLLAAISIIYQSILHDRGGEHQSLGADDFLPMLTYVLVHCGLIAAEVEAEYMWGLLHPSLLSGEGGYYLTTLSSAVHVLKHLQKCHADNTWSSRSGSGEGQKMALCLSELDGFMKVLIPNEQNGNIISKTVPVRPNMTTKDICKMVAHRLSITNPQDYALFKLVNGEEIPLGDGACPWMVKLELVSAGVECAFAYKRVDAKIAWPVNFRRA